MSVVVFKKANRKIRKKLLGRRNGRPCSTGEQNDGRKETPFGSESTSAPTRAAHPLLFTPMAGGTQDISRDAESRPR